MLSLYFNVETMRLDVSHYFLSHRMRYVQKKVRFCDKRNRPQFYVEKATVLNALFNLSTALLTPVQWKRSGRRDSQRGVNDAERAFDFC